MKLPMHLLSLFFLCLFVVGCADDHADSGHGHEHDDAETRMPYDALVTRICEHRDAIKAAFDADKLEEAHDPLHEIGHLIEQLPDSAAETDLVESDWNQVKDASKELMDAFGKVDALFHGDKEGVKFAEVEQEIGQAIAVLEEKAKILEDSSEASQP